MGDKFHQPILKESMLWKCNSENILRNNSRKLVEYKYVFLQKFTSQLSKVKQRCVHLLGVLGGSTNHALITSNPEELAKAAIAWDTEMHLKYQVPFIDIKPTIYFGKFTGTISWLVIYHITACMPL